MASQVYVLVKESSYADDSYDIIGVFESRELIERFISKELPEFKQDDDGDYYKVVESNSSIVEYEYLIVYENHLIKTV